MMIQGKVCSRYRRIIEWTVLFKLFTDGLVLFKYPGCMYVRIHAVVYAWG